MSVHVIPGSRPTDPIVVVCSCGNVATVIGPSEEPHCASCGARDFCDGCKNEMRSRGYSAPTASGEPSSASTNPDEGFAREVLRGAGLSEEYAGIIAARVMTPGADLSKEDQGYLDLIKRKKTTVGPWVKTPWNRSN